MKFVTILAAAALICAAGPVAAQSADVTVTLTGVEARGGHVLGSLSDGATFMRGEPQHTARASGDTAGTVTLVFHDVPPGDWALMVMHDEDDDQEFDMDGYMPAEGYAFSNSGGPLMGMPAFDDFKFTVSGPTTIQAPVIYP